MFENTYATPTPKVPKKTKTAMITKTTPSSTSKGLARLIENIVQGYVNVAKMPDFGLE
jgi:BRCT domain type II-containing protein